MMKNVPVIDMHCDTIGLLRSIEARRENLKSGFVPEEGFGYSFIVTDEELENGLDLRKNKRHVDLERLRSAGYMCQSLAMYVSDAAAKAARMSPFEYLCSMSELMVREVAKNSDIARMAYSGSEIEKNFKDGRVSVLMTVEEGFPYEGKVENLWEAFRRGVRKSTLTWNYENELAFGHKFERDPETGSPLMVADDEHGLKKKGFEFVEAMEEMGMIIDVAHLNDAGIRDILKTIRKSTPFISSHGNARGLCGHPRNLTDEFLKAMAEHGGVTGINFSHAFLADDQLHDPRKLSRISDMVEHVKYIKKVAGIDSVALGSDFDGINSSLEINGCGEMQKLACALEQAGFTDEEIEKVYYKNALRVYKEVLG